MTSKELYRRFISLCRKWPKDATKAGRDYGEYFRERISEQFPHGELGQVKDAKYVESTLSSLERIANNDYFNESSLKRSSASGLEGWACRDAVSNEGLKLINEDDDETSIMKKLKSNLSISFRFSKADTGSAKAIGPPSQEEKPSDSIKDK